MSEMERETRRGGKKGKVGRRIKGAKKATNQETYFYAQPWGFT